MTTIDASGSFPTLADWHELRVVRSPRRRRQRVVRSLLWLAIIGILAGNVYVLSQRNVTTAVNRTASSWRTNRSP